MPILNQVLFSLRMNNPTMSDQRQSPSPGSFLSYPSFLSFFFFSLVVILYRFVATGAAAAASLKSFCPS